MVDILTGDSPKLSNVSLVRKGQGLKINRRDAYDYRHLAYTFKGKMSEPFLVTVEPAPESEKPVLHEHSGQEFNYMLEGTMALYIGEAIYVLEEGDSIYFNQSNGANANLAALHYDAVNDHWSAPILLIGDEQYLENLNAAKSRLPSSGIESVEDVYGGGEGGESALGWGGIEYGGFGRW